MREVALHILLAGSCALWVKALCLGVRWRQFSFVWVLDCKSVTANDFLEHSVSSRQGCRCPRHDHLTGQEAYG